MSLDAQKNGHKYFPGELKRHLIQQFFLRALISVFSTSYVHPDEYFQSLEVTNKLFFDFETYIPWEFRSENALRTIISPILVSGVPYFFGYFLNFIHNGWYLLIAPKIQLVVLSLSIDVIGYRIHRKFVNEAEESNLATKGDISGSSSGETLLRLFSTSWSVLVFYSRPFSNTLEAFCLVYSLGVYLLCDTGMMKRCLLGFLFGFWRIYAIYLHSFFLTYWNFFIDGLLLHFQSPKHPNRHGQRSRR